MSNQHNIEILIVEDSPTQALQLQYILQKYDYSVSIAQNGVEGINYVSFVFKLKAQGQEVRNADES